MNTDRQSSQRARNACGHSSEELTVERIIQIVSTMSGIPVKAILSRNRTQEVADARHLAMFLACERFPSKSYEDLAPFFRRSGCAVRHGRFQTKVRSELETKLAIWVKLVRAALLLGG